MMEDNGRFAGEVVAQLRRTEGERGEGHKTARTAEELRRLLEVCGFGLATADALPSNSRLRGRMAALLGPELGGSRILLRGSTVAAPKAFAFPEFDSAP